VVWGRRDLGVKVRRAAGEQRYQQVSGGNLRGCLYLVDRVQPGLPLLVTEGEFDALTAWQLGWGKLSAVAIGSASYARINPRWHGRLLAAPRLLVCMDADEAGQAATAEIASSLGVVRVLSVPEQKDFNDYARTVGSAMATEWLLREVLSSSL
jgi:DNA primase